MNHDMPHRTTLIVGFALIALIPAIVGFIGLNSVRDRVLFMSYSTDMICIGAPARP